MKKGKYAFGVDLGGTSVKLGFFTSEGELIRKWEIPTDRTDDCVNVIPDIARSLRGEMEKEGIREDDLIGIGMGVPGPVQPDGYVEVCVNLHWHDLYPARQLSDLMGGVPVELGNDAAACRWSLEMTPTSLPSAKPGRAAEKARRMRSW